MKRPQDLFRDVMTANPRGSQKEHLDALFAIVRAPLALEDVPRLLTDVFFQWGEGRYPHRVVVETENGVVFNQGRLPKGPAKTGFSPGEEPVTDLAAARAKRAATKKRREDAAKVAATAFKARCLMDFALPDGTLLRDANAAKLERCGGWVTAVGKKLRKLGGGRPGTRMTEQQLHNIYHQVNGAAI